MPVFSVQMKSFTDHLQSSIEDRADALEMVNQSTETVLDAAREFIAGVTLEHHVMAGELRTNLTQFTDELSNRVEGLRKHHRENLNQTRADLRQRLDDNQAARRQAVNDMRAKFKEARTEVAGDLRGAQDAWREFAGTRNAKTHHAATDTAAPKRGTKSRHNKHTSGTA